eukprot:CAMPEP_0201708768 /NCGR_PEP_ID=MMETSP0578-20130828/56670_1 /ASSEMBLY_ACC=CAM_ASM_000663 /TAXON_ID=267565 /ORGANISM="Skeletonema grethea, Strain CCMP 1804" /LENGTH=166 /DNA_ID=CAMNT_0048197667 /DNA_START=11 /DNA_END=507 /DNA_ORIENTATION=+
MSVTDETKAVASEAASVPAESETAKEIENAADAPLETKMTNKRELTGLSCEQEEKIAEKAPKKNKTAETSIQPSYVVKEKTHKEAGFYGGDMVRSFVPRNELGDEVDVFLYWVFVEEEEFNMASYPCDDVNIENARNDDVASFFVPLDQSYMGSLSFFQDGKSSFA